MNEKRALIDCELFYFDKLPSSYKIPICDIRAISDRLARDIIVVSCRSLGLLDGWAYHQDTTLTHLRRLRSTLPDLIKLLGSDSDKLLREGLAGLYLDSDYWIVVEQQCEILSAIQGHAKGREIACSLIITLLYFARAHTGNPKLCSPCHIVIPESHPAAISPLYLISIDLFRECHWLLTRLVERTTMPISQLHAYIGQALRALRAVAQVERLMAGIIKEGLQYIASDFENCCEALNACQAQISKQGLAVLLRECDPRILGPNRRRVPADTPSIPIEYNNGKGDLKAAYLISPKIVEQAKEFLERVNANCLTAEPGGSPADFCSNFSAFCNMLYEQEEMLDPKDRSLLQRKGILALLENDGKLLRWLWEMQLFAPDIGIVRITGIKTMHRNKLAYSKYCIAVTGLLSFLTGRKVYVQRYYPYFLEFPHEGDPLQARFYSIKNIYESYPALGRDIVTAKGEILGSFEHDGKADVTVYTYFRYLKSIIEQTEHLFTPKEKHQLAVEGVKAFTLHHHRIMKKCLEFVQGKFKEGVISGDYGWGLQKALKIIVDHYGFPWIDSFRISFTRDSKLRDMQPDNDYYTTQEVVQLAFHIERLLAKPSLSRLHQLWLRSARIILKTNWNPTPVLNLTVDDIFELEFAGRQSYMVRLFKPRAGYSTQWNRFDIQAESLLEDDVKVGKEVLSVIKDLQFIKNNLTQDIRDKLPDSHQLKRALMLYIDETHSAGRTKKLTESFKSGLQGLLNVNGCQIIFTPSKIRKGGLNFIYRAVGKEFRRYKYAGNHTWEVFRKHYFRFEGAASENNLSKATSIMGDYFHGRPIAEEIKIVTDTEPYWQQVPNGKCASLGSDAQARAYNRAHHAVFKALGLDDSERCADFNACLWCEHYRCVADPEHAYRLLSYRDFVIYDMEASIGESLNTGLQTEYVDLFRQRVDQVLADMDAITPGCRQEAEMYIAENGIHPDWRLASTSSSLNLGL